MYKYIHLSMHGVTRCLDTFITQLNHQQKGIVSLDAHLIQKLNQVGLLTCLLLNYLFGKKLLE